MTTSLASRLRAALRSLRGTRLIIDREQRLGRRGLPTGYRTDIDKEALSREYVLDRPGAGMQFLDVGARDGSLTYLLGMRSNLEYDAAFHRENRRRFDDKYDYFAVDLLPAGPNVLAGDICSDRFLDAYGDRCGSFDVVYSNNVFEHLERPWVAAQNLYRLLREGGICITIVPFAQRYHESPGDFFRYTHTAIPKLFSLAGPVNPLVCGYDIAGRRNDWQGQGEANDIVPEDGFGAWRETWFTVCILEKGPAAP